MQWQVTVKINLFLNLFFKMDFEQHFKSFSTELENFMNLDHVSLAEVEWASTMFFEFEKFNLTEDRNCAVKFAICVYLYFVLIVQYAVHGGKMASPQPWQLNVKKAVNSVMFVVHKTKTYSHIIGILVEHFFDKLYIEDYREFSFIIQEFLKVYACFLWNVPKNVLEGLAHQHKNLHLLIDMVIDSHETNMQAAVLAVLLKLSKTSLLESMFPDISGSFSVEMDVEYPKIRQILETLNKNSTKLFSIHCNSIMLDDHLVFEYEGAKICHGVWLDIDLSFKKLSFFCAPTFLNQLTEDIQFGFTTNWEILSFNVEDCLETKFTSDDYEAIENVQIDIKIDMSKLNLFRNVKCGKILHLVFQIWKYSTNYDPFLNVILPQVFPNFPIENFAYTSEEVIDDVIDLTQDEDEILEPKLSNEDFNNNSIGDLNSIGANPQCCCCMLAKNKNCALFNFISTHVNKCKQEVFEQELPNC